MEYQVKVLNLMIKGHPHQELYQDFNNACISYDNLCKKYPYKTVELNQYVKTTLKKQKPLLRPLPTKCPRGHTGLRDKKPIVKQGLKEGIMECGVCGLFEVPVEKDT